MRVWLASLAARLASLDIEKMTEPQPLKLIARSGEDIQVISALLQDALLASADMQFIPDDTVCTTVSNSTIHLFHLACESHYSKIQ